MQFRSLVAAAAAVILSTLGTVSAGDGFLPVAYPFKCSNWCGPVVTVSQGHCINNALSCFCTAPHMKKLIPLCEACAYNARHVGNGKEFYPAIKQVMDACPDFKTTTVTQGFAAATAAPALAGGAVAAMVAVAAL